MGTKYFMYSRSQLDLRKKLEVKNGRTFVPGNVIINGVKKQYTELSNTPKNNKFSDSIIVWSGDISTVKYTEPTTV